METTSSIVNHLEDFLLESGPKQDCLVHICKYINADDIINLSESSKHSELFIEFFKDRVIDKNSFCDIDVSLKQEGENILDIF